MACRAKESGKVSRRGQPSIEWYKNGKPQYYCYGYIDKMTDELLPECKECQSHVYKAQDDSDKYNCRSHGEQKEGADRRNLYLSAMSRADLTSSVTSLPPQIGGWAGR